MAFEELRHSADDPRGINAKKNQNGLLMESMRNVPVNFYWFSISTIDHKFQKCAETKSKKCPLLNKVSNYNNTNIYRYIYNTQR